MYESTKTPGKKFGSAYAGKRYDSAHTEENETPAEEKHESPEMEKHEEETGSEHPVVKEHGKATTVHIKHDHVAKKHHVTSTHEDGHMHESDHQTPEEAHEEGGRLANISMKKSGEQEDQQLAASEGGNDHTPDGFEMPALS